MQSMNKTILTALLAALCFAGALLGTLLFLPSKPSQTFGSSSDNIFLTTLTASSVNVGKDIDTTVVATNTSRTYLEIGNISTSSAGQALFCNTNGNAAVLNSGFAIFASTTKIFNLDNLYLGALHCKYQSGTSSVSVVEH